MTLITNNAVGWTGHRGVCSGCNNYFECNNDEEIESVGTIDGETQYGLADCPVCKSHKTVHFNRPIPQPILTPQNLKLFHAAENLVSKFRTIQEPVGPSFEVNYAAFYAALNRLEVIILEYRHNFPSVTGSTPTSETEKNSSPSLEHAE